MTERPDDIVISRYQWRSEHEWPFTEVGFISHRRDLADLQEPYRTWVLNTREEEAKARPPVP